MRGILWSGLILLVLVIQATLLPLIAYEGVRPDLLLIIVVSSGLLFGKEQGVSVGFFCGLLQDLLSGNVFGLNVLSKLAIGYLCGLAERNVFKEHILLPILSMLVVTVLNNIFIYVLLFVLGYKVELPAITYNLLPLVLYNVAASIPIHHIIYRISQGK